MVWELKKVQSLLVFEADRMRFCARETGDTCDHGNHERKNGNAGHWGKESQAAKCELGREVERNGKEELLCGGDCGKGCHCRTNLEKQKVVGGKCVSHIYSVQPRPLTNGQEDSWRKPFANAVCDDRGDIDYGNSLPHCQAKSKGTGLIRVCVS